MTENKARLHLDGLPVSDTPYTDHLIECDDVIPVEEVRHLEQRRREAEATVAELQQKMAALQLDRDGWHHGWEEQRKVTGEVGLKLMSAEARVAELERELAWLRSGGDILSHLGKHIGEVVGAIDVLEHLASKSPADWRKA